MVQPRGEINGHPWYGGTQCMLYFCGGKWRAVLWEYYEKTKNTDFETCYSNIQSHSRTSSLIGNRNWYEYEKDMWRLSSRKNSGVVFLSYPNSYQLLHRYIDFNRVTLGHFSKNTICAGHYKKQGTDLINGRPWFRQYWHPSWGRSNPALRCFLYECRGRGWHASRLHTTNQKEDYFWLKQVRKGACYANVKSSHSGDLNGWRVDRFDNHPNRQWQEWHEGKFFMYTPLAGVDAVWEGVY